MQRYLHWGLALALLSTTTIGHAGDKPEMFVDIERSMTKQKDAATAAAKLVSGGASNADQLLQHLADPSAYVRDRLVEDMSKDWPDDALPALSKGFKTTNALLIESLAEIFQAKESAIANPLLLKAIGRKKLGEDARIACLRVLGASKDVTAYKPILKLYKKEKKAYRLKGEALAALAALDPTQTRPLLDIATKDKLRGLRMMVIELLRKADPAAATSLAANWISQFKKDKDKTWAPRQIFAALHSLRSTTARKNLKVELSAAIEAMITALDGAVGREKVELGDTLTDITRAEDLAPEAFAWKSWWDARKELWEPKDKDPKKPAKNEGGGGVTTQVRFHGVPIDSLRVAFIQDISGGMKNPTGGRGSKTPSKLAVSKKELNQVFAKLDQAAFVNVIYFASEFKACGPKPFPIKKARKKLIAFNNTQVVTTKRGYGRSNLYDSVRYALSQPNIDTIFILTEGGPSAGKHIDKSQFMKNLKQLNVFYRVRIQTLLLGTSKDGASFLKELATTTEGHYHDLKKLRGSK